MAGISRSLAGHEDSIAGPAKREWSELADADGDADEVSNLVPGEDLLNSSHN